MARTFLLCIALLAGALVPAASASTITFDDPDGDDFGTYVLTPGEGGGDFIVSGAVRTYGGQQVQTLQFTTYTSGDFFEFPTKYCPEELVDSGRVHCFAGQGPNGAEDALRYEGTDATDKLSLGVGDALPEWMDVTFHGRGGADKGSDDGAANSGLRVWNGGGGNDLLVGGPGADRMFGGDGDDELRGGAGAQELRGEAGNDDLTGDNFSEAFGGDVIDGGPGTDEGGEWYIPSKNVHPPISVTQDGVADDGRPGENDNVTSIERISTGGGSATLQGTDADDAFDVYAESSTTTLLAGNDRFDGGNGSETVDGGAGNDTLGGGFGNDTITGGPGQDAINADTSSYCGIYSCNVPFGNDIVLVRDGEADTVECGVGTDKVQADAADTIAPSCEEVDRGGGGGTTPGGTAPGGPAPGATAPDATFGFRWVGRRSLRTLLRSGSHFEVTCPGSCRVSGRLLLARKAVAAGRATLLKAGPAKVRLRVTRTARRKLKRLRRARLTLRVTVTGADGKPAGFSKALTFKK